MIDLLKKRLERGMTQKTLSSTCGVSAQMISMIENGNRVPSIRTAKRIAAALGFDWTEFFSAEHRGAG